MTTALKRSIEQVNEKEREGEKMGKIQGALWTSWAVSAHVCDHKKDHCQACPPLPKEEEAGYPQPLAPVILTASVHEYQPSREGLSKVAFVLGPLC